MLGFHFFQEVNNSPRAFNFMPGSLQAHLAVSHLAAGKPSGAAVQYAVRENYREKTSAKSPQRNNRMFSQLGGLWA
jgi:hypothetical protein